MGQIRLRIGTDGRVLDWIPIELPHHDLVSAIDQALKDASFTIPVVNGQPVIMDITASIPLYELVSDTVLSLTLSEHIESRMASMHPGQFQLVVSPYADLDRDLNLVSTGDSYNVVDENGMLISGTVKVDFYIDTQGFPRMMIADETADPILAEAAVMNIANMRFTAPTRNGRPTVVKARLPVVLGN